MNFANIHVNIEMICSRFAEHLQIVFIIEIFKKDIQPFKLIVIYIISRISSFILSEIYNLVLVFVQILLSDRNIAASGRSSVSVSVCP